MNFGERLLEKEACTASPAIRPPAMNSSLLGSWHMQQSSNQSSTLQAPAGLGPGAHCSMAFQKPSAEPKHMHAGEVEPDAGDPVRQGGSYCVVWSLEQQGAQDATPSCSSGVRCQKAGQGCIAGLRSNTLPISCPAFRLLINALSGVQ